MAVAQSILVVWLYFRDNHDHGDTDKGIAGSVTIKANEQGDEFRDAHAQAVPEIPPAVPVDKNVVSPRLERLRRTTLRRMNSRLSSSSTAGQITASVLNEDNVQLIRDLDKWFGIILTTTYTLFWIIM